MKNNNQHGKSPKKAMYFFWRVHARWRCDHANGYCISMNSHKIRKKHFKDKKSMMKPVLLTLCLCLYLAQMIDLHRQSRKISTNPDIKFVSSQF